MHTTCVAMFALQLVELILLEGLFTFQKKMFSPKQMIAHRNLVGLPWIAHCGASWGDMFIVTPIAVIVLDLYGSQWFVPDRYLTVVIVLSIDALMHWVWSKGTGTDSLCEDGGLTIAGWMHAIYMAISLTVIVFFYFHTKNINPTLLIAVSSLLTIHIALGNQMALSLYNILAPKWGLKSLSWWRINSFKDPVAVTTVLGVAIALFSRTYYILAHQ